jgi:hypothetical protein
MIRKAGCPTYLDLSSWLPSPSRCLSCGFHTNFEKGQAYDGWVLCSLWVAAETMLLCDGLKCDEAFHSFCLAIPLQ